MVIIYYVGCDMNFEVVSVCGRNLLFILHCLLLILGWGKVFLMIAYCFGVLKVCCIVWFVVCFGAVIDWVYRVFWSDRLLDLVDLCNYTFSHNS